MDRRAHAYLQPALDAINATFRVALRNALDDIIQCAETQPVKENRTMRAKFRVHSVTFRGDHTNPTTTREYTLGAIYDTSTPENERFTLATPWADMKMQVTNPAAVLTVGEDYYLDFTPCNPVQAAALRGEETVEDHSRDVTPAEGEQADADNSTPAEAQPEAVSGEQP